MMDKKLDYWTKNYQKNYHTNQGLLEITCGYPAPRKLSLDLDQFDRDAVPVDSGTLKAP